MSKLDGKTCKVIPSHLSVINSYNPGAGSSFPNTQQPSHTGSHNPPYSPDSGNHFVDVTNNPEVIVHTPHWSLLLSCWIVK